MGLVVLKNDFHGTETRVRPDADGCVSVRATKRALKDLCGMSDCCCGSIRGKGNPDFVMEQDNATGKYYMKILMTYEELVERERLEYEANCQGY